MYYKRNIGGLWFCPSPMLLEKVGQPKMFKKNNNHPQTVF